MSVGPHSLPKVAKKSAPGVIDRWRTLADAAKGRSTSDRVPMPQAVDAASIAKRTGKAPNWHRDTHLPLASDRSASKGRR